MKYAVRLLNEASESIPRIKPRTYSASQFRKYNRSDWGRHVTKRHQLGADRMHEHVRPRYLLLNNIPRTALPSDILRALRDGGAVDSSFPVTASEFCFVSWLAVVVSSNSMRIHKSLLLRLLSPERHHWHEHGISPLLLRPTPRLSIHTFRHILSSPLPRGCPPAASLIKIPMWTRTLRPSLMYNLLPQRRRNG